MIRIMQRHCSIVKRILINLIKFYKIFISPAIPHRCRFYPSCSSYALEVFEKFGIFKGIFIVLKRVLKCNPLFKGGLDKINPF
jgi:putative membrane protein insertion efficiency factor